MPNVMSRRGLFNRLSGRAGPPPSADPAADALLHAGRHREAAALYAACLEREPDQLDAGRKLGYCLLQMQQPERARQVWQYVLRIRPADDYCVLHTGLSHAMEGRIDAAITAWAAYANQDRPAIQRKIHSLRRQYAKGTPIDCDRVVQGFQALLDASDDAELPL
jgi:tetratricopeptide (TPR) repeat protein